MLGIVLTIARLTESLDDPVVGYVTDRTSSRWGRRIPYILFATPWWAVLFVLLFVPPTSGDSVSNLVWIFVVIQLHWLASNFSGAPLEALLPHLAKDHHDRVTIASMQMVFGVGGAVVGLSLSSLLVEFVGFPAMAVTVAAIALTARYTALFGCWSHARTDATPSTPGFRRSVTQTFSNPQFIAFLPSFIGFRVGQLMLTALLPFYVSEVLGDVGLLGFTGSENEGLFTFVLTALIIVGVLAGIPIFVPLARRSGKAAAFRVSMLWSAVALFALFFAGFLPGIPMLLQALPALFFAGLPLAGVFMLPEHHHRGHRRPRREAQRHPPRGDVLRHAEHAGEGSDGLLPADLRPGVAGRRHIRGSARAAPRGAGRGAAGARRLLLVPELLPDRGRAGARAGGGREGARLAENGISSGRQ